MSAADGRAQRCITGRMPMPLLSSLTACTMARKCTALCNYMRAAAESAECATAKHTRRAGHTSTVMVSATTATVL